MGFVDECTVLVKAGHGGSGAASFRREPYQPRGGPDGGNGGPGGDVVFEVSSHVRDLSWLAEHPHVSAGEGRPGRSSNRSGAAGPDRVVVVPEGTSVFDEEGVLADLVGEGIRAIVARGGRGGRGNAAFVGPRNRAPRTAEPGEPGEEKRLRVELRTVADVGLVGMPNAGKSTLLSKFTAARPKVAAYPFTTLSPNLGVAGDEERFVVADVPGLIEGAHEGKGLGHRFLRHVVRCRALVLVVDLSESDPEGALAALRHELGAYQSDLLTRPHVVVATKADLVDDPAARAEPLGPDAVVVSAMTGEGLELLHTRLADLVRSAGAVMTEPSPHVVLRPARPPFTVTREGARFIVQGRSVERWVGDTDLDDPREVSALQRRLLRAGVERALEAAGARRGDEVLIAGHTFEFIPEEDERSTGGG